MRWKSLVAGLALLLATVGGCKQRLYQPSDDYKYYLDHLPSGMMENDPSAYAHPITPISSVPTTVLDPDRPVRFLCLAEAIAIALEQGTVGNQSLAQQFINTQTSPNELLSSNDQPIVFAGNGTQGSDAIRVFRLDPAAVGAGIEASLSKFDAVWTTSMNWNTTDRPVATSTDTFTAAGTTTVIQQEAATFTSSLLKPLPTGGVAGITFNTNYTLTNLPAMANPAYQPSLQFAFEQPLLQGYGVEINQLRPSHPGSILFPGFFPNQSPTAEGILVTRIRFDQQRAEFERVVNIMLFNVEYAYWNLYNSYWQVYSKEQGLRQAYETWKISMAKFQAGQIALADIAQARGQYEDFRDQRISALNGLLENERQLRAMLGMLPDDCTRLVPCDTPTLAPYQPDWCSSVEEGLANRPELVLARDDIKANQLNVELQKNSLLPDLRFTATYDVNALGVKLDTPAGALGNLGNDHFNNWALGLRYTVPLGYRTAHANLRIARLHLARSYEVLKDQELKVQRYLALQYRRIITNYELIKVRRSEREAYADQLKARFQEFLAGREKVTINILLQAQQQWAAALANEYVAVRDYNNAMVGWEYGKGTILQRHHVTINEGPLPIPAQERAAEHEQERGKSLILRERAMPMPFAPVGVEHSPPTLAPPTPDQNVSLMDLWKKEPPLKDPKALPSVEQGLGGAKTVQTQAPVAGGAAAAPTKGVVLIPTASAGDAVKPAKYQPAPASPTSSYNPVRNAMPPSAPAGSVSGYNPTSWSRSSAPQDASTGTPRLVPITDGGASSAGLLIPPPPGLGSK